MQRDESHARSPCRARLVGLALALVTLAAYLPATRHGFVLYDDPEYLTQNRVVQAGLTLRGMRWAFTTFQGNLWIPLSWLSHMLDCEWFGVDPGAHHLVSALWHAANAALLFLVLRRMTGFVWPSAFAAALFAWHPLRVESVAWAAERKDVLSGLFFLLALGAYGRFAQGGGPLPSAMADPGAKGPNGQPPCSVSPPAFSIFYFLSLASFACGLMSKPMLVTFPLLLLLLDFWPLRRCELPPWPGWRRREAEPAWRRGLNRLLLEKVPFLALSVVVCVVTALASRGRAVGTEHYGLIDRAGNALAAYGSYLGKILVPVNLAIVYPLPARVPWGRAAAAAGVLALITALVWRARVQRPWWLIGWAWFVGTLVPVIGLVQVGTQALADRFTYLPFIGLAMALGCDGAFWARRWRLNPGLVVAAAAVVLVLCLAGTERQLRFWSSDERLFERALAVTADNPVAHANLGVALEQQGRRGEARAHYEAALELMPSLAQVHNNLANLLDEAGETNAALSHFLVARRLQPDAPLVRANYGSMLVKLGRFDEAAAEFEAAARLSPGDPRPFYLMGKALLRQGRPAEAVGRLQRALELDPNDVPSLVFLARLRAAETEAALRNGAQAVSLAERANALTGGDQPAVLEVLAMAYAEVGRFPEAQAAVRKAIAGSGAGDTNGVGELRERLKLFEASRPFRLAPAHER